MRGVIFSIEVGIKMENTLLIAIGSCFVLVGVSTGAFFVIEASRELQVPGGLLLLVSLSLLILKRSSTKGEMLAAAQMKPLRRS